LHNHPQKNLLNVLYFCDTVATMKKDDTYYSQVLAYAHKIEGSYRALAKTLGASSGPAVQAWLVNGVAYKWRPVLEKKYGLAYRKSLNELIV
jgi:hypothetical protein